jgi:hypothetical protein
MDVQSVIMGTSGGMFGVHSVATTKLSRLAQQTFGLAAGVEHWRYR